MTDIERLKEAFAAGYVAGVRHVVEKISARALATGRKELHDDLEHELAVIEHAIKTAKEEPIQ